MNRRRHPTLLACALPALLLLLIGCSSSDAATTTTAGRSTSLDTATVDAATVDTAGDGAAPQATTDRVTHLVLAGASGDELSDWTGGADGTCSSRTATVTRERGTVLVALWSVGCESHNAINGQHGVYEGTDDERVPQDAPVEAVPTGRAVTFMQTYTECTNSCRDFTEPVVLIELAAPADDRYPLVMLVSPQGSLDAGAVLEIARRLTLG